MKKFSIKEAFGFGFNIAKRNIFFYLGIFVITILISSINSSLQKNLVDQYFLYFVVSLVFWVISEFIGMGILRVNLSFVDGKKPKFMDIFILNGRNLLNYLLGSILVGVIIVIGFILLIVPGIIFALKLQYVTYLIVDKKLGPIEAIKKSWSMTKGHVWHLFVLLLAIIGVNILGTLALVVGLIITVPLSMVATAFVYRKLSA